MRLVNVNKGSWCSYCAHKRLCDNKECKMCYNNSFASHEKSEYCDLKFLNIDINKVNLRQIFKFSHDSYSFICENNHKFEKTLNKISEGHWCPVCINKTEI